jgi:hypothetical protein
MNDDVRSRQPKDDERDKHGKAGTDHGPKGADEKLDDALDKELEDSFPASDPPSLTQDPR